MSLTLNASPEAFPVLQQGGRVAVVRLSEADYREASFLDERLLAAGRTPQWASWDEIAAAAQAFGGEGDLIFHIGHVGSTLVSRLLDELPGVFGVREPGLLRALALERMTGEAADPRRLAIALALFGRVWRPGQRVVLKATSFVGEIGPTLMDLWPSARALLMFTPPAAYMGTILAGEASRGELAANAAMRLERLHRRIGGAAWDRAALSLGELAAMSWASEIAALADIARAAGGRATWLEFDGLLAAPDKGLTAVLTALRGEASPADLALMRASPAWGRYSKGPEHAYDAGLRAQVIAQARSEHAAQIARGARWLNAAGAAHPAIAAAIRAAAAAARG